MSWLVVQFTKERGAPISVLPATWKLSTNKAMWPTRNVERLKKTQCKPGVEPEWQECAISVKFAAGKLNFLTQVEILASDKFLQSYSVT